MYNSIMATLEDVEDLVKFRILEQEDDWKGLLPKLPDDLEVATREAFIARLNKDFYAFLIKKDGKIVATACLLIQYYLPQGDDTTGKRAYLCNVYTIPEERRKGHQKALMQEIMSFAKNNKIKRIDLHSSYDKNVRTMYEKLGYKFVDNNARLIVE